MGRDRKKALMVFAGAGFVTIRGGILIAVGLDSDALLSLWSVPVIVGFVVILVAVGEYLWRRNDGNGQ